VSSKRVCLLTGASGRLGTAFCGSCANEYEIVAVYRQHLPKAPGVEPIGSRTRREESHQRILAVQADLTSLSDQRRVIDVVLARHGKIDLLVNCAVRSVWASMLTSDRAMQSASTQFQVNVIVPLQLAVLCVRSYWGDRKAENLQNNRNVINLSSIAGSKVYPRLGQGIYAASKAALNQLSRHMADEFGEIGIRVNALAPNMFPTIVSTTSVIQSLIKIDQGTMTGRVLVLDRDGEMLG
jgi:NAD(P)-dependent dehydrogenase (short-subunit alcohol dehydrogenase family)